MSEYKENTVGYWLSQLKEPLKSRIVDTEEHSSKPCESLEGAISSYLNCLIENSMGWVFWKGVYVYFFGGFHIDSQNFKDGFNLAHECDPWREDKAIVDFPRGGIEAPERAVVGYEEPKPIDTIEKKHELRIKNLEARVKQLEDQLFKYFGSKNG